jgi:hypothetical protein
MAQVSLRDKIHETHICIEYCQRNCMCQMAYVRHTDLAPYISLDNKLAHSAYPRFHLLMQFLLGHMRFSLEIDLSSCQFHILELSNSNSFIFLHFSQVHKY